MLQLLEEAVVLAPLRCRLVSRLAGFPGCGLIMQDVRSLGPYSTHLRWVRGHGRRLWLKRGRLRLFLRAGRCINPFECVTKLFVNSPHRALDQSRLVTTLLCQPTESSVLSQQLGDQRWELFVQLLTRRFALSCSSGLIGHGYPLKVVLDGLKRCSTATTNYCQRRAASLRRYPGYFMS